MGYNFLRNGCEDGYCRYKCVSLGRCQSSKVGMVIDELGRLFTWAHNDYGPGEAGHGLYGAGPDHALEFIEYATLIPHAQRWLKAYGAETSSMALNDAGELWASGNAYANCAAFGLPIGSGSGASNDEFYYFTLCNSDYYWIDFMHDYYTTIAMDINRNLYFFGEDLDGDAGQGNWDGDIYQTPTLIAAIDNVMLIDGEYGPKAAVTVDNKVYYWGYFYGYWHFYENVPTELTGLPSSAEIVCLSACPYGVYVVLSDGTLWAAGVDAMWGDNLVSHPTGSDTFAQVTAFSGRNIVSVKAAGIGGFNAHVIDEDGNVFGTWYGLASNGWRGNGDLSTVELIWLLLGEDSENAHPYIDSLANTHQRCCYAIDRDGYLYTWGSQHWAPHFATGTVGYANDLNDYEPDITIALTRPIIGLASEFITRDGDPTYVNNLPSGESPYIGGT